MNTENKQSPDENTEYIGNIWGWRFSLISLALIVLMAGFIVYRHVTLGVPFDGWDPAKEETTTPPPPPDTIQVKTPAHE